VETDIAGRHVIPVSADIRNEVFQHSRPMRPRYESDGKWHRVGGLTAAVVAVGREL